MQLSKVEYASLSDESGARTATVEPVVDRQLVAELVARAQADGVAVGGKGGLLTQLTRLVLESSLQGEMDAHLGYGKHDAAGRDNGNSRNGARAKTVLAGQPGAFSHLTGYIP
jgi:putative transposase